MCADLFFSCCHVLLSFHIARVTCCSRTGALLCQQGAQTLRLLTLLPKPLLRFDKSQPQIRGGRFGVTPAFEKAGEGGGGVAGCMADHTLDQKETLAENFTPLVASVPLFALDGEGGRPDLKQAQLSCQRLQVISAALVAGCQQLDHGALGLANLPVQAGDLTQR